MLSTVQPSFVIPLKPIVCYTSMVRLSALRAPISTCLARFRATSFSGSRRVCTSREFRLTTIFSEHPMCRSPPHSDPVQLLLRLWSATHSHSDSIVSAERSSRTPFQPRNVGLSVYRLQRFNGKCCIARGLICFRVWHCKTTYCLKARA